MNRMRTGTSQSANIGLTDCRTKMVLSCSAVVMWHQLVHSLQSVSCRLRSEKTKRQKLLKSRLDRQQVSSPSTTHANRQHGSYKDQQTNIIISRNMTMSHSCSLQRLLSEAGKTRCSAIAERPTALQGALVLAKSGRLELELGDNMLRTL